MKNFLEALRSGWRAGLKQYRKRRTELRRPKVAIPVIAINQEPAQ